MAKSPKEKKPTRREKPVEPTGGPSAGSPALGDTSLQDADARWILAIEGAGDGVWDWHVPEAKVYFSHRWKSMLGYADHEIGSDLKEWSDRVHPEDMPAVMRDLQPHLEGKTPNYVNEHRVRCKDGNYKWILDRGMVFTRDAVGKPLRVVGTHTDITDRRQIEELVKESELRLSGIINSAMDAIITINESHRILVFNHAAAAMFRCPVEQAIGQPLNRFIPERFHASHTESIRKFGATGVHSRIMGMTSEVAGVRADGEEFPAEASISQVQVRGQKLFTVSLRDVSMRRRLEWESIEQWMQLQDVNASLSRKNAALREVLATVEAEKSEVGNNVLANIEKIILPAIASLRQRLPRGEIRTLDRIEADLKEITSPFVNKLTHSVSKLSPAEVRIASLIRRGLSVKQIAGIETISTETVAAHRRSIRRKLAITHSKVNLATFLDINFSSMDKSPNESDSPADTPSAISPKSR